MGAVCLLETDLPVQNRNDRRETRTIAAERWVNETWRQPFHRYYWVESKCLHTVVPRWFVALDLRPILSVACIVCLLEKRSFSCFIHAENVRMLWRRAKQFFSVVLFLLFPPPCDPTKQTLCLYTMSRGGRGGFRGGRDGGMGGAMQLVSFDLLKDLGSDTLFNVQTALFPVCSSLASFKK